MELTTLLLYVIAVSAVMVTPGPSMLLALNNGAIHGMRIASYGFLGGIGRFVADWRCRLRTRGVVAGL